jgi:hypothetical protein
MEINNNNVFKSIKKNITDNEFDNPLKITKKIINKISLDYTHQKYNIKV